MPLFFTLSILSFTMLMLPSPTWSADEAQESTPTEAGTEEDTEEGTPAPESTTKPPEPQAPPISYVTPDKAKARLDDVIRYLKAFQRESEIIEISGNDTNMAGLYLPENTGKPQGGVLILHDIGQHAQWPNTVTPIREYLPDYGWNTLSIFFDQYISKPLPEVEPFSFDNAIPVDPELFTPLENTENGNSPATATSEDLNENETKIETASETNSEQQPQADLEAVDSQTTEDPNSDPLDAVAASIDEVPEFVPPITQDTLEQPAIPREEAFIQDMVTRTEQGLNKLNELGQYNIVIIANGYSANWAAKLLEKKLTGNQKGYALILIDAQSSRYPDIALNDTLEKLDIPMLDIITRDDPEILRSSKKRKGAMLRNQNNQYMQLFLPAIKVSLNSRDNMISRRIRGWLLTHAAGEEVPITVKNY